MHAALMYFVPAPQVLRVTAVRMQLAILALIAADLSAGPDQHLSLRLASEFISDNV